MKHLYLFPSALLFLATTAAAQPTIAWQRTYAGPTGYSVDTTRDGAYFITASAEWGSTLLLKVDSLGDTIWTRTIEAQKYSRDGHQTSDGGFVCAGKAWSDSEANYKLSVCKLDTTGCVVWQWVSGDSGSSRGAAAVCETESGGVMSVGNTFYPALYNDLYLVKLDSVGHRQWSSRYGILYNDLGGADVIRAFDADYFAIGSGYTTNNALGIFAFKLSPSGNLRWSQVYQFGIWISDVGYACCQSRDGGYALVGTRYQPLVGHTRAVVLRIGDGGALRWCRIYGEVGDQNAYGVEEIANGDLVIVGSSSARGTTEAWVLAIDSSGNQRWQLCIPNTPSTQITQLRGIRQTRDGGFIVAGSSNGGVSLAKLCPEGANAGRITVVEDGPDSAGYRLVHESGQLTSLVFPNVVPGTRGSVSGEAANNWSVLPNGDGNNGDSIVFVTTVPLAADSVDTFWVTKVDRRCSVRWSAGCKTDTIHILNALVSGLSFTGATYGFPHTDITIHVDAEWDVNRYEVWWLDWQGHFRLAVSFPAVNDSGPHDYVLQDRIGHSQWLLVIEDVYGCRYIFSDRILILGQNVPAADPVVLAPLTYSLSAFPNPFNPSTTLSFSLPREGRARIAVFDVLGREVAVLADDVFTAGEHRITFDGSSLPSGLYFARLQSGNMQATHKLLLMK